MTGRSSGTEREPGSTSELPNEQTSRFDPWSDSAGPRRGGLGLYLREIWGPILTREEEVELGKRRDSGDASAREELIVRNLRLVIHQAKKFQGLGTPFEDVIQNGNMGLLTAADRWDWRRGYKFSTYATWWIRQAIQRRLHDADGIRIPFVLNPMFARIAEAERQHREATGRAPSEGDLAEAIGSNAAQVRRYRAALACRAVRSTDSPMSDDGDEFGDLVADMERDGSEAELEAFRLSLVEAMARCLTERERQILMLRYGLHDGIRRTLAEVAAAIGVTKERVRQLQNGALGKLRGQLGRTLFRYPALSGRMAMPGSEADAAGSRRQPWRSG